MYRCVKANDSDDVLVIGMDEKQAGFDYHGIGVWADFVFCEIPEVPEELLEISKNKCVFKIENNQIVLKTFEELDLDE